MHNDRYLDSPIFVTGLPRSGTSMIAGALHHCGAWVGETVAGGVGNPKGFYENVALREQLVKPLLTQLGCDPLGVKSLPQFDQVPNVSGLYEAFTQLIHSQGYTGAQPWLFKDAKLTLLWPLVVQVFPNARWVIVRRQPEAIIQSCMQTHFMAHHSQSEMFWQDFVAQYQQRLARLMASPYQVYEISADHMITGNRTDFIALSTELGLTGAEAALDHFVAPDLWHSRAS